MINTYKYNNETWIDIDHGTPGEIHSIMSNYAIHPMVAKELTSSTPKPRIEIHDGYIYCILHFPVFKHTHSEGKSQEVDFIIGRNLLITARYDTIDALDKFSKTLEVKEILERKNGYGPERTLFTRLLKELYLSLFEELEYIEDRTEQITSDIFKGKEKAMVVAISEVTRTLLDFKKITDQHHEILESLLKKSRDMIGEGFAKEIEQIISDYTKINTAIRTNLDILRELRDTNNSLLTSKQNETVKQLTVLGFAVLPLNLISWVFAMRTEGMPLIDHPNAFWIVLGMMATTALIMLMYAKYKKWM